MNRKFLTIGLAACLAIGLASYLILSPIVSASGAQDSSAVEQFRQRVMAAEMAYQSGDVDRAISFYAEDVVSYGPGSPALQGKAAFRAVLEQMYGTYKLERDFNLVAVEVAGNYATRTGEWTQTLTPYGGGDTITVTGRCILGWKKINGEWKVVWQIFNTY